jgi:hypothetical protein
MGGRFSRDNRPILPGAYFNVEAIQQTVIQPSAGQVVALPIVHTWGPEHVATLVTSFSEYEAIYGVDESPGRTAVMGALRGEDVPGWGGAGGVIVYRMTGTGAAPSSVVLKDTNATPANAVTLTARYAGSRGDRLRVAVLDTPGVTANTDLIVYDGTSELERYTFADANTQALVDAINAGSEWLTATRTGPGPLAIVGTAAPLAGGNDGSTLTGADWDAMLAALSVERFGVFAPFDLTDTTILAAVKQWGKDNNEAGRRFRIVTGGGKTPFSGGTETTDTAITRAATFNNPDFLVLGGFEVQDTDGVIYTSSQLAPRYAGILAQRGEVHGATCARLGGMDKVLYGPTTSQKVAQFKGGVVGVGRDSDPVSPIRFEAAVTTYTYTGDPLIPYAIFRNPKFVATTHSIEMEVTEYAEANVIGKTVVNEKTRDAVKGEMMNRLQRRVESGVIQANPTVEIDQNPPPTDSDEFISLIYGVRFGRSVEQMFGTLRVG